MRYFTLSDFCDAIMGLSEGNQEGIHAAFRMDKGHTGNRHSAGKTDGDLIERILQEEKKEDKLISSSKLNENIDSEKELLQAFLTSIHDVSKQRTSDELMVRKVFNWARERDMESKRAESTKQQTLKIDVPMGHLVGTGFKYMDQKFKEFETRTLRFILKYDSSAWLGFHLQSTFANIDVKDAKPTGRYYTKQQVIDQKLVDFSQFSTSEAGKEELGKAWFKALDLPRGIRAYETDLFKYNEGVNAILITNGEETLCVSKQFILHKIPGKNPQYVNSYQKITPQQFYKLCKKEPILCHAAQLASKQLVSIPGNRPNMRYKNTTIRFENTKGYCIVQNEQPPSSFECKASQLGLLFKQNSHGYWEYQRNNTVYITLNSIIQEMEHREAEFGFYKEIAEPIMEYGTRPILSIGSQNKDIISDLSASLKQYLCDRTNDHSAVTVKTAETGENTRIQLSRLDALMRQKTNDGVSVKTAALNYLSAYKEEYPELKRLSNTFGKLRKELHILPPDLKAADTSTPVGNTMKIAAEPFQNTGKDIAKICLLTMPVYEMASIAGPEAVDIAAKLQQTMGGNALLPIFSDLSLHTAEAMDRADELTEIRERQSEIGEARRAQEQYKSDIKIPLYTEEKSRREISFRSELADLSVSTKDYKKLQDVEFAKNGSAVFKGTDIPVEINVRSGDGTVTLSMERHNQITIPISAIPEDKMPALRTFAENMYREDKFKAAMEEQWYKISDLLESGNEICEFTGEKLITITPDKFEKDEQDYLIPDALLVEKIPEGFAIFRPGSDEQVVATEKDLCRREFVRNSMGIPDKLLDAIAIQYGVTKEADAEREPAKEEETLTHTKEDRMKGESFRDERDYYEDSSEH